MIAPPFYVGIAGLDLFTTISVLSRLSSKSFDDTATSCITNGLLQFNHRLLGESSNTVIAGYEQKIKDLNDDEHEWIVQVSKQTLHLIRMIAEEYNLAAHTLVKYCIIQSLMLTDIS